MALMVALLLSGQMVLLSTSEATFTGSTLSATSLAAPDFGTHADWVLADGATGYWRLNEQLAGHDWSTNGVEAATSGGLTAQVTGALGGATNKALRFDGTGGVDAPSATTYTFPGTAAFSVEAWVRPTVVDADYRSIAKCVNGDSVGTRDGWNLWQQSTYGIGFERFDAASTSDYTTTNTALTVGSWVHVVATYGASTLRLYLNGAQVASATGSKSITNRACTLRIGDWNGYPAGYFTGDLDEVALYRQP